MPTAPHREQLEGATGRSETCPYRDAHHGRATVPLDEPEIQELLNLE